MEEEYDVPMAYVDPGPAIPGAAPTSDPDKPWGKALLWLVPHNPWKEESLLVWWRIVMASGVKDRDMDSGAEIS